MTIVVYGYLTMDARHSYTAPDSGITMDKKQYTNLSRPLSVTNGNDQNLVDHLTEPGIRSDKTGDAGCEGLYRENIKDQKKETSYLQPLTEPGQEDKKASEDVPNSPGEYLVPVEESSGVPYLSLINESGEQNLKDAEAGEKKLGIYPTTLEQGTKDEAEDGVKNEYSAIEEDTYDCLKDENMAQLHKDNQELQERVRKMKTRLKVKTLL